MRLTLIGLLALLFTSCAPCRDPMRESALRAARQNTPMYFCWFVERDPSGQHGYSYNRGELSWQPPGGRGLFDTVAELRKALYAGGFIKISVTPHYPASVPPGWVIRTLTEGEAKSLQ
jgi:hypothetical protein